LRARGGSKRVPRKNVKILGGRPLIAYTIDAAKGSKVLDYFFVSTNDEEIAKVAKSLGAPVPF
jgi:N-acylneuraminate cytidylyltransferase